MAKKKKVTKKMLDAFVEKHCNLTIWQPEAEAIPMYAWKTDGGYACFNNLKSDLAWMIRAGIDDQIGHGIGFSTSEQKWFGWSHRAYYGFGIGHEVKFGDAGFVPRNEEEFIKTSIGFWSNESHTNIAATIGTNDRGERGAIVTWDYVPEHVPNKSLHGEKGENFMYFPKKWGRGEWKAETIEDAKQMAMEFRESVS